MNSASISDCMSTKFVRITPNMPVVEATARLIKNEMLGGPVVDEQGLLVGWLSEQECLQVAIQVVYHNTRIAMVKDIMRTDVLFARENDDPLGLAMRMLHNKPKTYPVINSARKVIGVVTRRHILQMLDDQLAEMARFAPAV